MVRVMVMVCLLLASYKDRMVVVDMLRRRLSRVVVVGADIRRIWVGTGCKHIWAWAGVGGRVAASTFRKMKA